MCSLTRYDHKEKTNPAWSWVVKGQHAQYSMRKEGQKSKELILLDPKQPTFPPKI